MLRDGAAGDVGPRRSSSKMAILGPGEIGIFFETFPPPPRIKQANPSNTYVDSSFRSCDPLISAADPWRKKRNRAVARGRAIAIVIGSGARPGAPF